ncbi:hypothetical protein AB1Y20_009189 [Prymnesium parvum]|uniref:Ribonuclease n=1 Tax=Prymnesium parvum TaxID=97485 RepID=A0AB34K489_PRYPA
MVTAATHLEATKLALGFKTIAGVDEAGRGPLVGPVVAAACVIPPGVELPGVTDSKTLSEEAREAAFEEITRLTSIGVGIVDNKQIDQINILEATMLAMELAVANLPCSPDAVLIDGNRVPSGFKDRNDLHAEAFVKGDSRSLSIAAASIVAKVTRDRLLYELHELHPEYKFNQHKGYPTAIHMAALHKYGPLPEHRYSFGPVARVAAARGIVTDTYVDRAKAAIDVSKPKKPNKRETSQKTLMTSFLTGTASGSSAKKPVGSLGAENSVGSPTKKPRVKASETESENAASTETSRRATRSSNPKKAV